MVWYCRGKAYAVGSLQDVRAPHVPYIFARQRLRQEGASLTARRASGSAEGRSTEAPDPFRPQCWTQRLQADRSVKSVQIRSLSCGFSRCRAHLGLGLEMKPQPVSRGRAVPSTGHHCRSGAFGDSRQKWADILELQQVELKMRRLGKYLLHVDPPNPGLDEPETQMLALQAE